MKSINEIEIKKIEYELYAECQSTAIESYCEDIQLFSERITPWLRVNDLDAPFLT